MNVVTAQLVNARFDGDHMGGWGGGWMWFSGVAMMALFVVLIVWLVRASSGPVSPGAAPRNPSDSGQEILAERYANGELTTAEYRERLNEMQ